MQHVESADAYEDGQQPITLEVPVIGREALLANKRAAGRPKDLADLEALEDE